jgi:uncharacterized coiled-coil DUF342 family protein
MGRRAFSIGAHMSENYQNLKRAIDMMHSQNVQKFRAIKQKRDELEQALTARITDLEERIDLLQGRLDEAIGLGG